MASAFDALAQPTRRAILDALREGERTVGQLAADLDVAQPSMSKHLKVLSDAGLVQARRDAQWRWYGLHLEPLLEIEAWLEPYRRIWAERLEALERHLDEMED